MVVTVNIFIIETISSYTQIPTVQITPLFMPTH